MSMGSKLSVVGLILAGSLLVAFSAAPRQEGAGQPTTKPPAPPSSPLPAPAKSQAAKPINTLCPVMGEEVDELTPTATYKGHVIGFCCPGCDVKWAGWTDAQRDAFVVKCLAKAPPMTGEKLAAAVVAGFGGADAKALSSVIDQDATITTDSADQGRWSAFRAGGFAGFTAPLALMTLKVERSETLQLPGGGSEVVRTFGLAQAGSRTVGRFALTLIITGADRKVTHLHWTRTAETPTGPGQPMR